MGDTPFDPRPPDRPPLDSQAATRLARAARAAEELCATLWEAMYDELRQPRARRVAELSERLAQVCSAITALAAETLEPEPGPPASAETPESAALESAALESAALESAVLEDAVHESAVPEIAAHDIRGESTAPSGDPSGEGAPAPIEPDEEGSVAGVKESGEDLVVWPEGGGEGSIALPEGGGQGSVAWAGSGGEGSVALPEGGGQGSVAWAGSGGEGSVALPEGGGQGSVAWAGGGGEGPVAWAGSGGEGSVASPEGGGEGSVAWAESIEAHLERYADDGLPFAVLLVEVRDVERLARAEHPSTLARLLDDIERAMGPELRSSDSVVRESHGRWWLTASRTDPLGARALAERLARTVRAAAAHRGIPLDLAVGVAVCPADGGDAAALAAHADVSLYVARAAGQPVAPLDDAA